jgi:isoleucyl-tRNA synthetase
LGLPWFADENLIEKQMEIKTKKQIQEMGLEKFNNACRASVFTS